MKTVIFDEWTDADLSHTQRYYRRNRERILARGRSAESKEKRALLREKNRPLWYARERARWAKMSESEKIEKQSRRYGLTYTDLLALFKSQNFQCKVCSKPVKLERNTKQDRGVIDHCHTSGKVRGILCNHCNQALGLMKENMTSIKQMYNYLEANQ